MEELTEQNRYAAWTLEKQTEQKQLLSRRDLLKGVAAFYLSAFIKPFARYDYLVDEKMKVDALIDIFNQRFEGKIMIDLDPENYADSLQKEGIDPIEPAKPTFQEIAYIYQLFNSIDTKTNTFSVTKQDGPTRLLFTRNSINTPLADGAGGKCICHYKSDENPSDQLLIMLQDDLLGLDMITTHEFMHESDVDSSELSPELVELRSRWGIIDEDFNFNFFTFPLLTSTYLWSFVFSRETTESAEPLFRFGFEPDYAFRRLFVETGEAVRSSGVKYIDDQQYYVRALNPTEAEFNHRYAGFDGSERIAELATFVAFKGKKGVQQSLGNGLRKGIREILDILQTDTILLPDARESTRNALLEYEGPVIKQIKSKLISGMESSQIIDDTVEWCIEGICESICLEFWNMDSRQIGEAKSLRNPYAFLGDLRITGFQSFLKTKSIMEKTGDDPNLLTSEWYLLPSADRVIAQAVEKAEELVGTGI